MRRAPPAQNSPLLQVAKSVSVFRNCVDRPHLRQRYTDKRVPAPTNEWDPPYTLCALKYLAPGVQTRVRWRAPLELPVQTAINAQWPAQLTGHCATYAPASI